MLQNQVNLTLFSTHDVCLRMERIWPKYRTTNRIKIKPFSLSPPRGASIHTKREPKKWGSLWGTQTPFHLKLIQLITHLIGPISGLRRWNNQRVECFSQRTTSHI